MAEALANRPYSDRLAVSPCALAPAAGPRHCRPCRAVPLGPEPPRAALAMDQHRKRLRRRRLAHKLGAAVVVSRELCRYNATYGSLGAGIGMMMWMWISLIVILFGAQLNSEVEHQTARDSTVRGEKPLGARGSVMADTVGKAQSRCGY